MDHTNVSRQRWHDHWLFLTHFRKSPRTVGAIAPSSERLARAMLNGLSLQTVPPVRVVELGPGTGAVTGEIVRRLPDGATCLAIDVDPVFSARVGARWPRIDSVCDQAERLVEIARARDLLPVCRLPACPRRARGRLSKRLSRPCGLAARSRPFSTRMRTDFLQRWPSVGP
jgi:hypothetical protein